MKLSSQPKPNLGAEGLCPLDAIAQPNSWGPPQPPVIPSEQTQSFIPVPPGCGPPAPLDHLKCSLQIKREGLLPCPPHRSLVAMAEWEPQGNIQCVPSKQNVQLLGNSVTLGLIPDK